MLKRPDFLQFVFLFIASSAVIKKIRKNVRILLNLRARKFHFLKY